MKKQKLMAKAWEVVTCPNNHPCFILTKEIRSGDTIGSGCFYALGNILQPHKGDHLRSILCPVCHVTVFGWADFYIGGELRGKRGRYVDEGGSIKTGVHNEKECV